MLDRRSDVVPDLLPQTVFLRNLEEHMILSAQMIELSGSFPSSF
jgi:hypothetical protein